MDTDRYQLTLEKVADIDRNLLPIEMIAKSFYN